MDPVAFAMKGEVLLVVMILPMPTGTAHLHL